MSHAYTDSPMQFLLWLRKSKLNQAGTAPVYLRIFLDTDTRSEYATGVRCRPEEWNAAKGRLRGNDPASRDTNATLSNLLARARLKASNLQEAVNAAPDLPATTPADVALALRPKRAPAPALLLPTLHQAIGTFGTKATSRYLAVNAWQWLADWPGADKLSLAAFTAERAGAWAGWLRTQQLAPKSVLTYISVLAALLAHACPTHPKVLAGQRKGLDGQQRPRRALPVDWQQQLAALTLPRAQALARDVFLLGYYLHGSRIGAVLELTWQQVDKAAGRVRFTTHKRAVHMNVALRPELLRLLERYPSGGSPFVLPLLPADYFARSAEAQLAALRNATVKVNAGLRQIAKKLPLGHLHSHLARHTLALNSYKKNGNDLRVPQQLLGHKHISTTAAYIASLTTDELDASAANAYD